MGNVKYDELYHLTEIALSTDDGTLRSAAVIDALRELQRQARYSPSINFQYDVANVFAQYFDAETDSVSNQQYIELRKAFTAM